MGNEGDVSYLLKTHKPRIVVDEDGGEVQPDNSASHSSCYLVGEINFGASPLSSRAASRDSPPKELQDEKGLSLICSCPSFFVGEIFLNLCCFEMAPW